MEKENYYSEVKNLPIGFKLLQFYYKYLGRYLTALSGIIFWKIFFLPKKRKIRKRHQLFLSSAKAETILFDGMNIKAYHWGDGEKKILIVHGWAGMSVDFRQIITVLTQKSYQVMAIDLPAHGKSSGKRTHLPMIIKLIEKIITEHGPFYGIVSHSLGASASVFSLANLNGNSELSKLVLMGLHPFPFVFFEQIKQVLNIEDELFDKCITYVERKVKVKVREYSVQNVTSMISVKNVLLVHDEKDQVAHIENIITLKKGWDETVLFKGQHGGHFKHFKHPEVVNRIVQFMNQEV